MNFIELAFKRIDGTWIETVDYIDWANELLESGCDAPSIAELASCSWDASPDPQQVERIFQSCILELNLALPNDWYDALRSLTSHICQKMLCGLLEPWDCMQEMLALSDDHDTPYLMWIWIDLSRDLTPAHHRDPADTLFNGALDLVNEDDCIRMTAQQWVELCSTPLADKFPMVWWCEECASVSDQSTFTDLKTQFCASCVAISSMKNMRFFEHREILLEKAAAAMKRKR